MHEHCPYQTYMIGRYTLAHVYSVQCVGPVNHNASKMEKHLLLSVKCIIQMGSTANLLISIKYEIDHLYTQALFKFVDFVFLEPLCIFFSSFFVSRSKVGSSKKIYRLCFTWTCLNRSDIFILFMLFQLISFNLQFHTYLYAVCIQLVEFLVPRFRFLTILYLIWHQLILFCTYIVIFLHHDPSRYNVSF